LRQKRETCDLLVVGAGIAGLSAALAGAESGASVLVLSKASHRASNSYAAQGGVAAAIDRNDDPSLHAVDTLVAGRGLCRPSAVEQLVEEAPARIEHLRRLGVHFDVGLAREGGHSRARVVHAGGADTGRHIAEVLTARAREHLGIRVVEGERVLGLLKADGRCAGAATTSVSVQARATVLATGGYAALWCRTTNPPGALGDGLLLAHRAGAALADLELVQFHPTALRGGNGHDGFLLSEALRGAGATLLDAEGERFVDELAPRDVVARAIAARAGTRLDLRAIERGRYPSLMATLERAGYDPADEPIPVSPASHYAIGGIVSDLDGRTTLPGLYAAGECLVFGRRAGVAALAEPETASEPVLFGDDQAMVTRDVREALWHDAGLIRGRTGLTRLLAAAHPLVRLVAASALAREESRGVHFREDFPAESDALAGHLVVHPDRQTPALKRWS
jgi:L-aspartate oxidase